MTDLSDLDALAQRIFRQLFGPSPAASTQEAWTHFLQETRQLSPLADDRKARVIQLINELSEGQRRAIQLHLSGMRYLEIAEREGKPPGVMLQELADAYTKIRFALMY